MLLVVRLALMGIVKQGKGRRLTLYINSRLQTASSERPTQSEGGQIYTMYNENAS